MWKEKKISIVDLELHRFRIHGGSFKNGPQRFVLSLLTLVLLFFLSTIVPLGIGAPEFKRK